jgi:hypothetical protein
MNLTYLIECSLQIAWEYLERSGELGEPREAGDFLLRSIEEMVRHGERRRLILSNKAIDQYRKFRREKLAA